MPELTVQDMAARLRGERFTRTEPGAQALGDPIADTPMVVTLEELRPYDLNPRLTRNPKYDEIKASIKERGLDAPPAITRRPGESHFMIRAGGNTRLSILRELWTETREERFFRIPCLWRPWSARGEIVALTGHLAENELHGELSFIERALGVEKARELYEQEIGKPLSQRELARRLTTDGYPISNSLVSRMQDTVRQLLPAIPSVLYGGLGKHQVERLGALRKAASRVWERHALSAQPATDFPTLFQDVLSSFDADPEGFDTRRVQDELLRQMARLLASDYDTLALEIIDAEGLADAISRDPTGQPPLNSPFPMPQRTTPHSSFAADAPRSMGAPARPPRPSTTTAATQPEQEHTSHDEEFTDDPPQDPAVPDAESTAEATIERSVDASSRLRAQIAQLAAEIAEEGSLAHRIEAVDDGVGFICVARSKEPPPSRFQRALLTLLTVLSAADIGPLSDAGVARLFQLIGLTRQLIDLKSTDASPSAGESA